MRRFRKLLVRTATSPSIHFQVGSIALMLFQSFAVPFFIGVASFGAQMLFLAPVFLAQALLEPSYQAEMNASCLDGKCSINLTSVIAQALIFMGIAVPLSIGDYGIVNLLLVAIGYTVYTALLAAIFALKTTALAAIARHAALAAYIITFAAAAHLGAHGEIVIANLASFIVGSVVVGAIIVAKGMITFRFGRPHFAALLGGLTFRLPTISFSGLATILLGYAGASSSTIGAFRIFMAAINAGRYFNLVPLPSLQAATHRFVAEGDRSVFEMAKRYIASFAVFAALLVGIFPVAYSMAFGEPAFSRWSLLFASTFILVQPLSYLVYINRSESAFFNVMLSVTLSLATVGGFYLLFVTSGKAGIAVSVSITVLTVAYAFVAYLTTETKSPHEVDVPRRNMVDRQSRALGRS